MLPTISWDDNIILWETPNMILGSGCGHSRQKQCNHNQLSHGHLQRSLEEVQKSTFSVATYCTYPTDYMKTGLANSCRHAICNVNSQLLDTLNSRHIHFNRQWQEVPIFIQQPASIADTLLIIVKGLCTKVSVI